jgi:hypothetical protein
MIGFVVEAAAPGRVAPIIAVTNEEELRPIE